MVKISESKVLSALLTDNQMNHALQSNMDVLMVTHGDVWMFIKDYYAANDLVPPASVVMDRFPDFVLDMNVGSTKHHLDELRHEYLDRELRVAIRGAANHIQDDRAEDAMQLLFDSMRELNRQTSSVKDVDASDTDSAVAYMKEVIEDAKGARGIRTGIPALDQCFPAGIRGGQFGVLLAYPGVGKSFVALYFLAQAWLQGYTPMIISLEMTEADVRNRLYTILGKGRWSLRKLASGDIDIEEFKTWHSKTFDGKPQFSIISTDTLDGEVTPETVRAKIDQYKPDIVVCDYMQLMTDSQRSTNETVKMKNLSSDLKKAGMAKKVPIIGISSATPTDATDMSSAPTLGQTAWSRQMAYDADWMLALGRDPNDDIMEVVGRKNREGMLPDFLLQVDFDSGMFTFQGFPDLSTL